MSEVPTRFKVTLEFDVEIDPISVPDGKTLESLIPPEKMLSAKKGKPKAFPNYQMLLYPQYETSVAAQQALQAEILQDPELSNAFVQEMVRDTTRGQIEALLDDKCGVSDLAGVLQRAMGRLSPQHQALLKTDEESLVHDETELVDSSVSVRFAKVGVTRD